MRSTSHSIHGSSAATAGSVSCVSHTMLRPGISGVPLARAAISKLDGVCAASGRQRAPAQSSAKAKRNAVIPNPNVVIPNRRMRRRVIKDKP
jgi:hypothetical protein